jgi:Protein of unknown function (DUF4446)
VSDLNRVFSENLAIVIILLGIVAAGLLVVVIVEARALHRATAAYRSLVRGQAGGSLEEVLGGHIGQVHEVSSRVADLTTLYDYLELRSRGSLQHIGLVRFNPFPDTGSDQSFALALLDDSRDGVVLSSLHGRTSTRIFAKPVEAGGSTHALSDEESQAIRIAVEGTSPIPRLG